ncbi:endonuclease/exonuclease/phosphatase family protein [Frondihabitans peucedani]|uniref:Endonuclease/exonuclease/phosphatase domain-containing protein n=1 Tax=Frondihabitans peucedani TaxID=598626 RepID=A0ABP8E3Y4_9MICO
MLRRFVSFVLLLAIAAALFVVCFPQVVGLQRSYGFSQLLAFRGVLVVVAVVAAVVILLLALVIRPVRGFFGGLGVLLLVFAAVSAGVVVERGTGSTSFDAKKSGDITVVAWNTEGGAPGSATIAQLALAQHANIVSLPETQRKTGDEVAAIMKRSGVTMSVLTLAYDQRDTALSTTLLISANLGEYETSADKTTTPWLPTLVARPSDGDGPVIVAVHPASPVKSHMADWRAGLKYLSKLCSGESMIMAGDFNSTLDHQSGLGATPSSSLGKCRDAAKVTSNAGVGTWPTNVPELLATPIDHVMNTSDYTVTGFKVITNQDSAGSDHRPIVAQLTPRASD